jgi:hypothetical protein
MRRTMIGVLVACGVIAALAAPAAAHESGDSSSVDETHLPVGTTSTSPKVGSYWSCQTSFDPNAGGAQGTLPWLNGDGTWDATKKKVVDGDVSWPDAKLTITRRGAHRVISTKDLPTDHTTGVFPISPNDDAYQSDRNPNSIATQDFRLSIPANPTVASQPSCGGGEVGILKSGVLLFAPIDAGGRDAVAYETQDKCDGHPQVSGAYHYHNVSRCVLKALDSKRGQSKLVGWAFDGFGIYGPRDAKGHTLTNADLDECHGITSTVEFNGKRQRIYHYVATEEYPYVVGCFRGTNAVGHGVTTGGPPGQSGAAAGMPPGAARNGGPPQGGLPPSGPPPGGPGFPPPPQTI